MGRWFQERRRALWGTGLFLLAVGLFLGAGPSPAQAQTVGANNVTLHLKVLSYCRNLSELTKGKLIIGVLYPASDTSGAGTRAVAALQSIPKGVVVGGMRPRVIGVPISSAADIPQSVSVFLVTGPVPDWQGVLAESTKRRAPILATTSSLVEKGATVGVTHSRQGHRVLLNVKAAKRLRMKIDSGFLRLATLIR